MSQTPNPAVLLEVARRAADAAAAAHREGRDRIDPVDWGEKGRSDFVTEVDVEAERRIVEIIQAEFPDHGILAEEGTGGKRSNSDGSGPDCAGREPGVRWIIDPLDGTTNWLHGYPEYAVSIAAEDAEGLVVGLVLNSAVGERFEARRGGGATRDGLPIEVSGVARLEHALVGTGFPFKKLEMMSDYLATFDRVLRRTSGIRRAGAAALDLCDLACGRLDAFFEYWLMPWDVAAGALIVRESGGIFEPLDLSLPAEQRGDDGRNPTSVRLRPGGFLAANGPLAARFRTLVTQEHDGTA
ncbi:MAG: inositol monophosphatase family protein [Gemmatimonadota bacterium]